MVVRWRSLGSVDSLVHLGHDNHRFRLAKLVQQRGIAIDSAVETQLLKIIEAFRHEPKRLEQVIARSTAPVDGQDGTLEWMKGFDPTAGPAAAVTQDDSGAVDYYNQVSYVGVAEGTHVATLHEPTPGEDGRDVTGRTIKAKPGRRYDVKIDSSLDVDASGRVIAQVDGILEYEHGVLKVSRLFEIRGAVDFGTGNVDFDGTVIVRDGIRDRFELKAAETAERLAQSESQLAAERAQWNEELKRMREGS